MTVSGGVRTAAVLFTDLVESTALRSRLGEVAAERLRVVHDGLVRRAIEGAGGTVVKTLGDGTMATFLSAADAVAAAVAVQQGIDRHNHRSGGERLGVRVGVSVGDVDFDGTDCHGLPVVEAQRLESTARPGQILCADLVVALARGRGDHVFEPVGSLVLKGLPAPVAASAVAWEPLAGLGDAGLPPVLRQGSALPFTGREAEAAVLADAWARCRDGGFAVVLVAGEPGIGKTRLVSEAAADAQAEGAVVLAGRCDEDLRVPFGPFVGALRWMVEHVAPEDLRGRLGKHPGELATLVPEVAHLVAGVVPSPPADAATERFRLCQAVCSWLGSGGTQSPTVLVLDDVHWADAGTVLLLRHLVGAAPAGLLVLGTYRDTEISRAHPLGAALADLRQAGPVTRVALRGLDGAGVRDLFEAASGRALEASGVAFADVVCAETAGNPLFVGQVLRHLAETGDLVLRDGRWTSGRDLASIGIPEGIEEVIGRRLSRLPSETEAVLRTAAIIGHEFDIAILATVVDRPEADVLSVLEQAVTAALVTEVAVDRFRFSHALVRETLHSELTASRRARAHRRVAEAIERRNVDDLEQVAAELALHWGEASAGGDPTVAVEWASRAGERALTGRAPDEAANWFARALALLDDNASQEVRLRLLLRRADAQARAIDPGAAPTANAAARLALRSGDVEAAVTALCLTATISNASQAPDEEKIELLDLVLERVGDDQPAVRGRLLAELAGELEVVGAFDRRLLVLAELRGLMDTIDDPVERWGLMKRGTVDPGQGWGERAAVEKVRAWCEEALGRLDDPFERIRAYSLLWSVTATLGDRAGCDRTLAALTDETPATELAGNIFAAADAYLDGRFDDCRSHVEAALERLEAAQNPEALLVWWCREFTLRREQGGIGELPELLERRMGSQPTPPDITAPNTAITQLLTGEAHLVSLDESEPSKIVDGVERVIRVAWLAELAAAVGDHRLVRSMLDLVESRVGMHLLTGGVYWGSYDRLTALLRDRLGDHELADEAFARAIQATQALRTPVWVARTELDWAESLLRRDLRAEAAEHVQAARAAIGDLELIDSRNRCDQLEARLG